MKRYSCVRIYSAGEDKLLAWFEDVTEAFEAIFARIRNWLSTMESPFTDAMPFPV